LKRNPEDLNPGNLELVNEKEDGVLGGALAGALFAPKEGLFTDEDGLLADEVVGLLTEDCLDLEDCLDWPKEGLFEGRGPAGGRRTSGRAFGG